jgi:uncharacterized protein (TIGR02145 family)
MSDDSISTKLQELFDLFKSGALSQDEFDLIKSELLNDVNILRIEKKEPTNQIAQPIKQDDIIKKNVTKVENDKSKEQFLSESKIIDNTESKIPNLGISEKLNTLPTKKKNSKKWIIASSCILLTLIIFGLISFMNNYYEKKKLSELVASGDIEMAYKFKAKYPNSSFNIDSLIQRLEYHKLLVSSKTAEYNEFLNKFPYSIYQDSVKTRLYKLALNDFKTDRNQSAAIDYIDKYPESPYIEEAQDWLYDNAASGVFLDKRDGHKYSWAKIDNQIWMTERLIYNNSYVYTYDANKDVLAEACPAGWHIPVKAEWLNAIELNTKVPMGDVAMVENSDLFSKIARDNYSFWVSPSPNDEFYADVSFRSTNGHTENGSFYVQFAPWSRESHFIVCIKDSENKNSFDSDKYVKDVCGNIYRTVKIGDKLWMNDDLVTTKFSNGDDIPTTSSNFCDEDRPIYQWKSTFYGRFYTGYVVEDKRNLCPSGWHVTTMEDWTDAVPIMKKNVELNENNTLLFAKSGYKPCNTQSAEDNGYTICYWTSGKLSVILNNWGNHDSFSQKAGLCVRCVKD